MTDKLGTGVVGCGLIGRRRASVAGEAKRSRLVAVTDVVPSVASDVASQHGADAVADWRSLIARKDVDVVVIATPNAQLAEIGIAALKAGKHVLIEKPMGRNLAEARALAAAQQASGKLLKIGFNHRFHPALAEARERFERGEIGSLISIRCRYGHGGRPGYEKEWRGSRELAGGGELTDQGVHVLDLMNWFAGVPTSAYAALQTAVWPLGDLEDNAFAVLRYKNGAVGSFHTSWTQWKNLFSFEVFGDKGSLTVEGLGRSYGIETLHIHTRKPEGGVPDMQVKQFEGEDRSWELEWDDFLSAILDGKPMLGTHADGVAVMRMLDALYRSASSDAPVTLAVA